MVLSHSKHAAAATPVNSTSDIDRTAPARPGLQARGQRNDRVWFGTLCGIR